jgi:mRNA interferase RelE/StbE
MVYRIEWKQSAFKELKQLPQSVANKMLVAVESLAENPYPTGTRKLAVAESTYRLCVGDY